MPTTYIRQNQIDTTVVVDGEPIGIFATFSGGDVTADGTKIRPAAMSKQVSLGALPEIDDVTVGRHFHPFRDSPLTGRLRAKVGSARVTVTTVYLDAEGRPFSGAGNPYWTGVLVGVKAPESDSDSNDGAMFELIVSCDGVG